ncbi:TPA: replication protein, partial [Enterococcus faecium]|nr:replication protein [Enterococcus faecium]
MTSRKTKDERTRNWTFVVYPESAPENWREFLDEL